MEFIRIRFCAGIPGYFDHHMILPGMSTPSRHTTFPHPDSDPIPIQTDSKVPPQKQEIVYVTEPKTQIG